MHTSRYTTIVFSLMSVVCVLAVTCIVRAQESYKVDESPELRCDLSEVPQITDSPSPIFVALNENKDAKAAIVVYGMEGASRVYARDIKKWMSRVREIDPDRLIEMYGGKSEELRLELWLIPRGASPPNFSIVDDNNNATLFDTYTYSNGEECRPGRPPALIQFGDALKERSGWIGYIVIRPYRNGPADSAGTENWDPDGYVSHRQAFRRAARDKRFLVDRFGISASRIRAVIGNDGKWSHAELWLVPPGVAPPSFRIQSSSR